MAPTSKSILSIFILICLVQCVRGILVTSQGYGYIYPGDDYTITWLKADGPVTIKLQLWVVEKYENIETICSKSFAHSLASPLHCTT
jgi:hypothetical protein